MDFRVSPIGDEANNDIGSMFHVAETTTLAKHLPLALSLKLEHVDTIRHLETLAKLKCVFVLPQTILDTPAALDVCKALVHEGWLFGIEIESPALLRQVPITIFSFVRYDATLARQEFTGFDLVFADSTNLQRMATNVETYEMFDWLTAKGFGWLDSQFLTTRNPKLPPEPDITRLKLLKLLTIVKDDGDTREIEAIFREEPKLAYQLLRLVNSVAVGAKTKISNFGQAVSILGRRQLLRWLQLLIYADNLGDNSKANPLMQIAAQRGRQMELLSTAFTQELAPEEALAFSENAFMTGLFSLLDVLINLPMTEIVKELPMHEEVNSVLVKQQADCTLSKMLALVSNTSLNKANQTPELIRDLGIETTAHNQALIAASTWAMQITG